MRGVGTMVLLVGLCACDKLFLGDPPPSHRATIAAGFAHTCRLLDNGTLSCWGDNAFGQVGTMENVLEVLVPTSIGAQTWRALAAGDAHTCAIDEARAVWCWGDNALGQLGLGSVTTAPPTKVLAGARAIAIGFSSTCALLDDRTLSCWGRNNSFQLGDATSAEPKRMPTPVHPDRTWNAIALTDGTTCALDTAGELYCWGDNYFGILTPGVASPPAAEPQAIAPGIRWRTIVAGNQHVCGLRGDGIIRCWGRNSFAQLGVETAMAVASNDVQPPDQVGAWRDVFVGSERSCATRDDNSLWCWGRNTMGEVGAGEAILVRPTQIEPATPWLEIALGGLHACALDGDEALWCTGNRAFGQLGDGTGGSAPTPQRVDGRWNAITVGANHVCARTDGVGNVHCWGDNRFGQVGDGSELPRQSPVMVLAGMDSTLPLSAGLAHTCAIGGSPPTPKCWGANDVAQVGQAPRRSVVVPTTPMFDQVVKEIVAGGTHSCVIVGNDELACWGSNEYGQLSSQPPDDTLHPQPLFTGGAHSSLAIGLRHTCAIANGALYCYGHNNSGQRDGDMVPGSWVRTGAGDEHACAIDTTSRVTCWGNNRSGQIGNGVIESKTTPTKIEGVFDRVVAGTAHTCARIIGASDDRMRCWGDNTRGQLGDGTRNQRTTPIAVAGDKQWLRLAAGGSTTCGIEVGSEQALYCWGSNLFGQLGDNNAWRTQFVKLP